MNCDIHGIEYDGFFGSCPACKAAERSKQDILDAHARSLEESRRQTEILERMQNEEEARNWQQQRALDDIAEAQKRQLAEQLQRRRVEEVRSALRAGLPEFSDDFQYEWRKLNEQVSSVTQLESKYEGQKALWRTELEKKKDEAEAIRDGLRARLRGAFDSFFRSADKTQLRSLESGSILDPGKMASAAPVFKEVARAKYLSRIEHLDSRIPDHPAPLVLALESLGRALNAALPLGTVGLGYYVVMFLLPFVFFGWVCSAIFSMAAPDVGLSIAAILALAASVLLGLRENDKRSLGIAELQNFLLKGSQLSSILLGRIPPPVNTLVNRVADVYDSAEIARWAKALGEDFAEVSRTLYGDLFELYARSRFSQGLEGTNLCDLEEEIEEREGRLKALEVNFEDSGQAKAVIKRRHSAMEKMILGVGKEIIEGLRVVGKGIELVPCVQCSEKTRSDLDSCLYCGGISPASN